MILRGILFGLILTFFGNVRADGQSMVSDSFIGARSVAMGSADMGEPHDISSMYGNPATIALLENPSVMLNHVQGIHKEMQEDLAFPLVYSHNQMLAFGAEFYSIGELTSSTFSKRFAVGYDVAFASKIIPTLSMGGSVSFRRAYVPHLTNATGASYTLGLDYTPSRDANYGLTLSGLGTGVNFATESSIVTPVQVVLRRALEASAVLRFPTEASLQPAYLTLALASQKIFGLAGVNYMGGVEFYPIHFLAFRFGYSTGPSGTQQRYGLGVRAGVFAIDAALYPVKFEGSKYLFEQVSASVEF